MKTRFRYIALFFFLLFASRSKAQQPVLWELKVGDEVPNLNLSGWLDDTAKKVPLADLHKNKLLILDFWATWCGSCIYELPKLDSLKNIFRNNLEVVAVGYQDHATINAFFEQHAESRPHYLCVLSGDKLLSNLFPHKGLPHLVWINAEGRVVSITDGEDVTAKNIREMTQNGSLSVEQKIDDIQFDFRQPFHLRDTSFSARSIFTNRTDGILSYEGTFGDKPRIINRIFVSNLPIRTLYWIAAFHHELSFSNFDRLVLEVKDSLKFMQPKFAYAAYKRSKYFDPESWQSTAWEKDNVYCYELILPQPRADTILYQFMIADLNRYLNLNGRFEKRQMECFILTYKKDSGQSVTKSSEKPEILYRESEPVWGLDVPFKLKAQNVTALVSFLNMAINKSQIVDETGIDPGSLFDFDLKGLKKGGSSEQMNTLLAPYGLTLTKAVRSVRVFVLSEN